jgi:hypothetical protein
VVELLWRCVCTCLSPFDKACTIYYSYLWIMTFYKVLEAGNDGRSTSQV